MLIRIDGLHVTILKNILIADDGTRMKKIELIYADKSVLNPCYLCHQRSILIADDRTRKKRTEPICTDKSVLNPCYQCDQPSLSFAKN